MNYKQPLSLEQQITYLKNNKRLVYSSIKEDEAMDTLLRNNYINVISPFKYAFAKKDDKGVVIKLNNKHVYERNVDFAEYKSKYDEERIIYPDLYNKISIFERTFNAVVSYKVLLAYNINNDYNFNLFVNDLLNNVNENSTFNQKEKNHMINRINGFNDELKRYNSPYIFFDRLSLSGIVTVYRLLNNALKVEIFHILKEIDATIGYPSMPQFDEALIRLIQVRNCIYHNDSLTILLRYYRIEDNALRSTTDKKKFNNLIKHLLAD